MRLTLRSIRRGLRGLLGLQTLSEPIGRVRVPHSSKRWLRSSFSQQGEDLIVDRILSRVLKRDLSAQGFFLDVGAFHPVSHSVTYLLYLRGWKGVAFDPSSATHKAFKKFRPEDTFVEAVVGDEDGKEVDFYFAPSSDDMNLINTKYPEPDQEYRHARFSQVNLNEELHRLNAPEIDVLNIDAEGAELEILKSLDFAKWAPKVIAVEIHGNNMLKALETDVAKFILEQGYRPVGSAVITYFFAKEDCIPD